MMHHTPQRGFTLLIAVVLAAVVLAIGMALLDIAYKQVSLASTAKNSQFAFYAADAALECALYYDQKLAHFPRFPSTAQPAPIYCTGQSITVNPPTAANGLTTTTFTIPCAGGNNAFVQVSKSAAGNTTIYAYGYNLCNTADPRRIERGLKVIY